MPVNRKAVWATELMISNCLRFIRVNANNIAKILVSTAAIHRRIG